MPKQYIPPDGVTIIDAHDKESRRARALQFKELFPENKYPYKLFCGHCGASISYYLINTEGKNPYQIYRCQNHKSSAKNFCPKTNILVDDLDELILQEISKERKLARWIDSEINESAESLYHQVERKYQLDSQNIYDQIRKVNQQQFHFFQKWKEGCITEQEYISERAKCIDLENQLVKQWTLKQKELHYLPYNFNINNKWLRTMRSLPEPFVLSLDEIKRLILRIDISLDNQVQITWRSNLMREHLYYYLKDIGKLPLDFLNPPHYDSINRAYYMLTKE